jgi:hypothetical protein
MTEIGELRTGHRYLFYSNSSTLLPSDIFRATLLKKERNRLYLSDIYIISSETSYEYVNWTVHTQFLKKIEALEDMVQNTKLPDDILRIIDTYL